MANVREMVKKFVDEYVEKNPPTAGGRRKIYMPAPRPEDEREPYITEGPVPEGYTRAEITKPMVDPNEPGASRKGGVWVSCKHPDNANPRTERVFTGDIVDIPNDQYAILDKRNWVKPCQTKAPDATKPRAILSTTG